MKNKWSKKERQSFEICRPIAGRKKKGGAKREGGETGRERRHTKNRIISVEREKRNINTKIKGRQTK